MVESEKLNNFLEELSALSNKYGLVIGGCGCCGSPWIEGINSNESYDDLSFEEGKYRVKIDEG